MFTFDFLELILSPAKKAPLTLVVLGLKEETNPAGLKFIRSGSIWSGGGTTQPYFPEACCFGLDTGFMKSLDYLVSVRYVCLYELLLSSDGDWVRFLFW